MRLKPRVAVSRFDDLERNNFQILLHFAIIETSADEALCAVERVLRVRDRLTTRRIADEAIAIFCERDNRRRRSIADAVFDYLNRLNALINLQITTNRCRFSLHNGNTRVCCAEIDADN